MGSELCGAFGGLGFPLGTTDLGERNGGGIRGSVDESVPRLVDAEQLTFSPSSPYVGPSQGLPPLGSCDSCWNLYHALV